MEHSRQNYITGSFPARGAFLYSRWHTLAIETAGCTLKNTNVTWTHIEARHLEERSLCTYALLHSLKCNLNCVLGWEKVRCHVFFRRKENGWALWLCKVGLSVPLRSSSTLRARMRAVLRTDVQFSGHLGLQGSPWFVWKLRGQVREIISFQAGIPEGLCWSLRDRMRAGIRMQMKFITSFKLRVTLRSAAG